MRITDRVYKAIPLFFVLLISCITSSSQVIWDGEGGDGQWTTAANWAGNTVPSATDNVILDNSIISTNYVVTLPAGNTFVTIRSLTISPGAGLHIEVVLPVTNVLTGIPAFTVTGPGYGLVINAGGIFRNASGASSGNTVAIADSLRINNGGRYSHNTPRSHASLVAILSKAPGTETGIFEFDVPGSTSFIPSLPGRTYGTLVFSAAAAGGNRAYNSSGVQNVTVRGDLIIGNGVSCSVSFAGNFIIKGNLVQQGGTFNIANSAENTNILLEGDLVQQGGILTESGTAFPVIRLNGATPQNITGNGSLTGSVTLRVTNAAGVTLQSPFSLPYKLELVNGKINTTAANILILAPGCTVTVDSLSSNSFINGPLRKEGLNAAAGFLFPVGKDNSLRWLALRNATGSFTVEFVKGSPQTISTQYTNGIDHVSGLEYWHLRADATPVSAANVELSFVDPNSGGVTNMSSLRVAAYSGAGWIDAGNILSTGMAGSRGSVVSNALNASALTTAVFSLGSSDATNPLPSKWRQFTVQSQHALAFLQWKIDGNAGASHFEIFSSTDNRHYLPLTIVRAHSGQYEYYFSDKQVQPGICYYRICMVEENGTRTYSGIVPVRIKTSAIRLLSVNPTLVREQCWLNITSGEEGQGNIKIWDNCGRMVKTINYTIQPGIQSIPLEVSNLHKGVYTVQVYIKNEPQITARFVKW